MPKASVTHTKRNTHDPGNCKWLAYAWTERHSIRLVSNIKGFKFPSWVFVSHMQHREKKFITTENSLIYGFNEIRYKEAGKIIFILHNDHKYLLFPFTCLFVYFGLLSLIRYNLSINA